MHIIKLLHVVVRHIWKKNSDWYHHFIPPCQPPSFPNPVDSWQESPCCGDDECNVPDAQPQRGSTETMEVDRNLHITNGLPDPLPGSLWLNLVMNCIQRVKAHPPKVKLPVTHLVLHRLRKVFLSAKQGHDVHSMLRTILWFPPDSRIQSS